MTSDRRFYVWLDSGANHSSKMSEVVSLSELGITSEQWDAMSEKDREDVMRDVAFNRSDWGFRELQQGENPEVN